MVTNFCCEADGVFIVLSHWILLTSFLEANWWHFTDPNNLGISFSASIIFLSATFLPSMFIGLSQAYSLKLSVLKRVAIKLTPSILLFLSSLPIFSTLPWTRTGILATGVAVSPLFFIVSFSDTFTNGRDSKKIYRFEVDNGRSIKKVAEAKNSHVSIQEVKQVFISKSGSARNAHAKVGHSETIILVSLLINLFIRWSFGTINIFYENWKASLALCLLVTVVAVITCNIKTQLEWRKNANDDLNYDEAVKDDLIIDYEKKQNIALRQNQTDFKSSEVGLQSEFVSNINLLKAGDKRFQYVSAYVQGCVQGFTFGTLLIIFVWSFNTPNLLARWSNLNPDNYGIFFIFIFGCGILVSTVKCKISQSSFLQLKSKEKRKFNQVCTLFIDFFCCFLCSLYYSPVLM